MLGSLRLIFAIVRRMATSVAGVSSSPSSSSVSSDSLSSSPSSSSKSLPSFSLTAIVGQIRIVSENYARRMSSSRSLRTLNAFS
jgi:hypothetical protein